MDQFKFGWKVVCTAKFVRRRRMININRDEKYWRKVDFPVTRTGIYLGLRTLSDGLAVHTEDDWYFETTKRFPVAFVVLSSRENPIYVPLDCITLWTGDKLWTGENQ